MENKYNIVNHEFNKVIFEDSKILILGSIPSILSRKHKFYYMNKTNRFYKVLSLVFDDENFLNENINIKINTLKKHKIALYDVIESCKIINSSDSSIMDVKLTNIDELIDNYPIKCIVLNGKKAYELFIKNYKHLIDMCIYLPSTSAANATFTLDKLYDQWKILSNL